MSFKLFITHFTSSEIKQTSLYWFPVFSGADGLAHGIRFKFDASLEDHAFMGLRISEASFITPNTQPCVSVMFSRGRGSLFHGAFPLREVRVVYVLHVMYRRVAHRLCCAELCVLSRCVVHRCVF